MSSELVREATAATEAAPEAREEGPLEAGDQVLLVLEDGKTFLIRLAPGRRHSTHRGAIDHNDLIGRPWGSRLRTLSGREVLALRPTWLDRMMKVHRRTNIMYPKDVAQLLAGLDIGPGSRVVEIGCGSGAMSQALARAISPGGRLYSYDRRPEFLDLAASNCIASGVADVIEFRSREPEDPLEPRVDAVFCDIPEPWVELPVIFDALRGSGRFAAGVPTYNQVERLAAALHGQGFGMVETVEILIREILARPGRTRPAHRMIGHTQLLTSAVKAYPLPPPEEGAEEVTVDTDAATGSESDDTLESAGIDGEAGSGEPEAADRADHADHADTAGESGALSESSTDPPATNP